MAHNVEPMDIDSDFDNKENSLHHNNVLPFTEKGYEELDVSELNMKLRYSITPASSPMSKSYTANCLDNRSLESGDGSLNVTVNENSNLTRSLNSTMTKNDNVLKSLKAIPLQALPTEQFVDNSRTSVLRQLDSSVAQDKNITVTISDTNDIDENLSLPSSSSSAVQTPEATTPTKGIPLNDGGSPIMRGLKSVLNMFRPSQSPIPPAGNEDIIKPDVLSPNDITSINEANAQALLASTPISVRRKKETSPMKRSSPHKDSIVFNDDLETELQWKDETTILFSQERIPIHKLFFQQPQVEDNKEIELQNPTLHDTMNSTVEYMDISYNDSMKDKTMTDIQIAHNKTDCTTAGESDGEFVDCETTFTKGESLIVKNVNMTPVMTQDLDKTPVIDMVQELDKTPVVNIMQDLDKTPVINEMQDLDKTPVFDMIQDLHKSPAIDVIQNLDKTSVIDKIQDSHIIPAIDVIQDLDKRPAVHEIQDFDKTPIIDKLQDLDKTPAIDSIQDFDKTPIIDKLQDLDKTPAIDSIQDFDKTPIIDKLQDLDKTPAIDKIQDLNKTPPIDKIQDLHKAPAIDVKQNLDKTSVLDKIQDLDETPAIDKVQDSHKNPAIDEIQDLDKSPAVHEIQDLDKTTAIDKVQDLDTTPVIDMIQELDKTTVVNMMQGLDKIPAIDEIPDLEKSSVIDKTQDLDKTPVIDKIQDLHKTPAVNEIQDLDKTSVIDKTLNLNTTSTFDNTQDLNLTTDIENENTSASRLKQIILNTTQDILDATLSITPEDLNPDLLNKTTDMSGAAEVPEITNIEIANNIQQEQANKITDKECLTSEKSPEIIPIMNQTLDITSLSANIEIKKEDTSITQIISNESVPQPILNQKIETRIEHSEVSNVTKTLENNPSQTVTQNQSIITHPDNVNSIVTNKSIVLETKKNESQVTDSSTMSSLIVELDKTSVNVLPVIDCAPLNTESIKSETSSLDTIEAIHKSLLAPYGKVETSHIKEVTEIIPKEALMNELPVHIPLPDEDDFDLPVDINQSTKDNPSPNNFPPDLVDDIEIKSEYPEIVHSVPSKGMDNNIVENVNDAVNVTLPEVLSPVNLEGGDSIRNQGIVLDFEINTLSKELQNVKNDVLSENASLSNIVISENKMDTLEVLDDVNLINKIEVVTESLNTGVPNKQFDNKAMMQMDINESIIELKPLPDIINETNAMSTVANLATNVAVPVVVEKTTSVSENLENMSNEIPISKMNSAATDNLVPEFSSDENVSEIVKPKNLSNYVTKDTLPVTPLIEDVIKVPGTVSDDLRDTSEITMDTQLVKNNSIPTEHITIVNEIQVLDMDKLPFNDSEVKTEEEEIILSENDSPFVSVIAENIPKVGPEEVVQSDNIEETFSINNKLANTPLASPPIASKGYNFNFDEMDDPFATKTKIRLSPPLDTPTKAVEIKEKPKNIEKLLPKREIINRRKSQPERKRPAAPKRKCNSTFSGPIREDMPEKSIEKFAAGDIQLDSPANIALLPGNVNIEEEKIIHETSIIHEARIVHEASTVCEEALNAAKKVLNFKPEIEPEEKIEQQTTTSSVDAIETVESDTALTKEIKTTSSSEQSTYYSAGNSSCESIPTRNVFNLPEIDDMNFNPFATKSKMCQSPPPTLDIENPFTTIFKVRSPPNASISVSENYDKLKVRDTTKMFYSDEKIETELMEKDASGNLSDTTTSSKAADEKDATIREVHTEDEDTIEGPFLEAEDLRSEDKMSDFDGANIDMMQFNELPAQGNEENLDTGELFIDAEAFEFLLNQNMCNTVVDSGKESLFLKFDPLFAKRMSSVTSDGVAASLGKIQKRQSTPTKAVRSPQDKVMSPVAGPSKLNVTQDMDMDISDDFNDDLNVTVSKPMMVVPPAVNPVTPRNKSLTPNRSNRRSITFTSPAMAVIDRLLSLSSNNSLHDTTVTHVSREQNEADLALTQLRELLAEKEVHVYSLRSESKELKDRLTTLETHLTSLESESQDRLKKINDLNDRLAEKTKINKSMAAVVEEYERTIASLISETAQDRKRHAEERIKLVSERDEQTAHLASMEVSFSDLHSKYEKSKQVILNCKANEDAYKKSIKSFEENLTKMQNNYELLKQHATSKLNHANQELEKMNKTHEAEVLKLNAMIKRKELHITSLEESLAQKTKANEELTAICDELINKVG